MKTELLNVICKHHTSVRGYCSRTIHSIIVFLDPKTLNSYIWTTTSGNAARFFEEGCSYNIKANVNDRNILTHVEILSKGEKNYEKLFNME